MSKLEKVYLFASPFNQYGVIDAFIHDLAKALQGQGVEARIIEANRDDPKGFLDDILSDPPDCTLSFNGLLPDGDGRFLADLIKVPHVAFLVDPPHHFFPLVRSEYTIITCIDQDFCQFFRQFKFPRVLFLPHAVSSSLKPNREEKSLYDVLMLVSFVDYEAIRQEWQKRYPAALGKVLEEAAEKTLAERDITYLQAFVESLDRHLRAGEAIDPRQIDYAELLNDLQAYIVAKSRVDLLRSIRDVDVHLFGSQNDAAGWSKYLKGHPHIHTHPSVPYKEALELMRRSKILLNITPQIKRGTHERILSGLMCGSAVVTLETPFMAEHFKDGEDIVFYGPQRWDELNQKIHFYLQDDAKRQQLVYNGREKVLQAHTWEQRAQTLIQELPNLIEQVGS